MSEHLAVKGKVKYYHCSFGDKDEITYCPRCRDTCKKAVFEIHQGMEGYWLKFVCGRCKKTIWVAGLFDRNNFEGYGDSKYTIKEVEDMFSERFLQRIKDDKICCICRKPTNHYDCVVSSMSSQNKKTFPKDVVYKYETVYLCSKACNKKREKMKEATVE